MRKLNNAGKTIIMVTHENDIAAWARRAVRMRDGRIESDVRNDVPPPASVDRCHAAPNIPSPTNSP